MRKAALVLALLLAAAAAPAAQRWAEEYERGLAAVAAQDWSAVAAAMQSATRQNPTEALALKLRRRTVAYVPWYWLGLAQLESGDPAAALDSFRASERQGVIVKTALYGDFRKAMSRAQGALAQPSAGGGRAPGAAAFQDAIRAAVASQGKAMLAGATRSGTYRTASLKLQEARERAKGETAEGLAEGAKLATQADELFRRAAAEQASSRKTSKTVRSAMQPAPAQAEATEVAAEAAAPQSVVPAPETVAEAEPQPAAAAPSPRLVERTASMLRSLRKEASSDRAKGDPRVVSRGDLDAIEMRLLAASTDEEVSGIQKEIAEELTSLRAITSAVPKAEDAGRTAARGAALESAYRALAAGDPEESERILSELLATTESAEAYLLRGCARYTQGTLAKRKDLVDAAREDLGRALRIDRRLQLDARYFSPKLVELLAEVRRGL
ncbi:MAG TPA: hypothetical protein VGF40_19135 [Thermoanaerobaculia bacterium]